MRCLPGLAMTMSALAVGVAAAPAGASFPGRDGRIVYTRTNGLGNQTVWSVDPRSGEQRQLTQVPERCAHERVGWLDDVPAYSASGRHVFFSHSGGCGKRQAPDGLYRIPANGGRPRLVVRDRKLRATWWPAPTASGSRLLFVNDLSISRRRDPDGYSDTIFSAPLRAGRVRRLSPRHATSDEFPAVSAAGRVAFARDRLRLVVGPARGPLPRGGGLTAVATTGRPWAFSSPDFSPSGRRIVFARDSHKRGFHSDLFVVGSRGGGLRRLTRNAAAVSPVWSPSGRWIAFVRAPDDSKPFKGPLIVMDRRGRHRRTVLRGIDHVRLSWQPLR